ncbi:putative MFS family arabinose efflux permease [Chitinophaga skermanii]|uniref:Putative MFS family arabinose efflux permease n=1 Tax=Chitinophaga skermanii TaxID=331697 RepID=A0A327QNI8_9BACT|nr:MFS transporter [Chitinophaga skermanii]RAJ05455.1 putative MFS family arabinose efflux permease [Chitinophaga skermanii]
MKTVNKQLILIIASMGIFVEALDIAIVNLALPGIEKDLGLTSEASYKLQSVYVLVYGCFLILGGKLSDFFGRKKIFIWGTSIFMFTSLGAGLSHTFELLILFRSLQGLGAALLMPAAFSIVNYYFTEPQERSRAIAIFSSFAAIGSGSGLSIGGIIASYWGWSWVFLINVPVLLVVIVLAVVLLENATTKKAGFPDIPSALALVVAMLCLTWVTELLSTPIEHAPQIAIALFTFGLSTYILYTRLRKQASPLLDLKVLSLASLKKGNTLFILLGALFTSYLFIMSFLVQKNFHLSAANAGFIMMPFNVISVLIARFVLPVITKRMSSKRVAFYGALAMLFGALNLVAAIHLHSLVFLLLGGSFIAGVGMTLCFTGYSVLSMQQVPVEHLGVGGSLTSTAYFVGGGIGLPLISIFMQNEDGLSNSIPLIMLAGMAILSMIVLLRKPKYNIPVEQLPA